MSSRVAITLRQGCKGIVGLASLVIQGSTPAGSPPEREGIGPLHRLAKCLKRLSRVQPQPGLEIELQHCGLGEEGKDRLAAARLLLLRDRQA